jgi:hypothetical protein
VLRTGSSDVDRFNNLLHACTRALGTAVDPTPTSVLIPRTMIVGPRMLAFQREVLRLQVILCTCKEVQAIVSVVALEGSRVAEEANEVLGIVILS